MHLISDISCTNLWSTPTRQACVLSTVDFSQLNPGDGTHLGRPWSQRHGFGRMCLVSGQTLSLRGPSSQALTLLEAPLFKGVPTGPKSFFGAARRVWSTVLPSDPPLKKPCATLVRMVGRSTNSAICCWSCLLSSVTFFYLSCEEWVLQWINKERTPWHSSRSDFITCCVQEMRQGQFLRI